MSSPNARTLPIRVVLVDDSMICLHQIKEILEVDGQIEVVGQGSRGEEALTLLKQLHPDLLVVDLVMPGQGGQETVALVMARHPLPILVLTAQPERVRQLAAFDAIRRGALDLAEKPHRGDREAEERLRRSVRTLASVPVVRHMAAARGAVSARLASRDPPCADRFSAPRPDRPYARQVARRTNARRSIQPAPEMPPPTRDHSSEPPSTRRGKAGTGTLVVGIGASAGGPAPLATLLGALPGDFPAAVAVVQHLPLGFADGFAEYLRGRVAMTVRKVDGRERIRPGIVYLAADDRHLVATSEGCLGPSAAPPVEGHRPAVDTLLSSLASLYGSRACGIILSGIGQDGTRGLMEMRDRGALTMAQSEDGCAVFGMPQYALSSGAARLALRPEELAKELLRFAASTSIVKAAP